MVRVHEAAYGPAGRTGKWRRGGTMVGRCRYEGMSRPGPYSCWPQYHNCRHSNLNKKYLFYKNVPDLTGVYTMMTETVKVDFHFVLVEEFVMSWRWSSFHGTEILTPTCPSSVFFQPFFFCSSGNKKLNNCCHSKILTNLFWNQTWTTLISRPVSWLSCSLTCLAGFGLLL